MPSANIGAVSLNLGLFLLVLPSIWLSLASFWVSLASFWLSLASFWLSSALSRVASALSDSSMILMMSARLWPGLALLSPPLKELLWEWCGPPLFLSAPERESRFLDPPLNSDSSLLEEWCLLGDCSRPRRDGEWPLLLGGERSLLDGTGERFLLEFSDDPFLLEGSGGWFLLDGSGERFLRDDGGERSRLGGGGRGKSEPAVPLAFNPWSLVWGPLELIPLSEWLSIWERLVLSGECVLLPSFDFERISVPSFSLSRLDCSLSLTLPFARGALTFWPSLPIFPNFWLTPTPNSFCWGVVLEASARLSSSPLPGFSAGVAASCASLAIGWLLICVESDCDSFGSATEGLEIAGEVKPDCWALAWIPRPQPMVLLSDCFLAGGSDGGSAAEGENSLHKRCIISVTDRYHHTCNDTNTREGYLNADTLQI